MNRKKDYPTPSELAFRDWLTEHYNSIECPSAYVLAEAYGCSVDSIRSYLKNLQRKGLISYEAEHEIRHWYNIEILE